MTIIRIGTVMRLIRLTVKILPVIFIFLGCSSGEDITNAPPSYLRGEVVIRNESTVVIRLIEFTQIRGEIRHSNNLNIRVASGHGYTLTNRIDSGDSDEFPGGDLVTVRFVSEARDPGNPDRPLFENTISHRVNGNSTIYVKSGGRYGTSP